MSAERSTPSTPFVPGQVWVHRQSRLRIQIGRIEGVVGWCLYPDDKTPVGRRGNPGQTLRRYVLDKRFTELHELEV